MLIKTQITIYVEDKDKTKMFFSILFDAKILRDENDFCEVKLPKKLILRIINKVYLNDLFDNDFIKSNNTPSSNLEFFFEVENPEIMHNKARQLGALEIRKFGKTPFDKKTVFSINHDGHIIAFSKSKR